MVNMTHNPVSVNINVRTQSTDVPEIRLVCVAAEDGTFADLRAVLLEDEIVKEGEKIVFLLPDGRFAAKSAERHLKWHTVLKDDEVTIIRMDGETGDSVSNSSRSADGKSSSKDQWGTAPDIPRNPAIPSGPPNILPGSSIAVVNAKPSQFLLFYQNTECQITQTEYTAGSWTSSPGLFHAAPLTPLSAISWDKGAEIRVYYLNEESILQEYCFSNKANSWNAGGLNKLNLKTARNSSIAALCFGNVHIRVYFQVDTSNNIQEFCCQSSWTRGSVLPSALSGTALAAISLYPHHNTGLRLYYQAEDLSVREHCFDHHHGWYAGMIGFGKAPACTSMSAFYYFRPNDVVINIFWVSAEGMIAQRECLNGWPWGRTTSTVAGPVEPGAKVAAAQWGEGKYLRVYYAPTKDSLLEVCNEGNGWFEQ